MNQSDRFRPPVQNIAHRGARSLAPENTLAAAQKALAAGADAWEIDVAMTADGELIVIHDDTLPRTSNAAELFPQRAPWAVHQFTLAEISRLDFGAWFINEDPFGQLAAGAISAADRAKYLNLPVLTLREALAFTRDHRWRINVEIKDLGGTAGDATVVEAVVRLIERFSLTGTALVSSFNHTYLSRVKATNPALPTGALVETSVADPVALLRRLEAQAYHPAREIITPAQIANLRQAGFEVNVWTVNDEADMRALLAAGVTGLITDYPQRLKPVLLEQ